ncbi:hypothetical protein INR77_12540 [Erythrobacter sp. SCSIO 43205]|uniref:hypothetical protein n=1 Tax=Erythrobacter sp. SCSIO 43205 TaxID=2779361 RepID=UPI001CA8D1F4|nr:hypothetical protein [Erythrobacter sp. SCSIO 43205]UAB77611.1 hypothetical protein INR77_12540 [Erythrobacter sp. SCSIO 43205]
MRKIIFVTALAATACKPPPTDADMLREVPEAKDFASAPLPSPDVTGALWAVSQTTENRLIYGVPGEASLIALECTGSSIQITRNSPADEGAGAMLALVGNGHIGRLPVDATRMGGRYFWVGEVPAMSDVWEPLAGPRELIATVPGAGTVELHPSPLPGALIEACRAGEPFDPASLGEPEEPEDEPSTAP